MLLQPVKIIHAVNKVRSATNQGVDAVFVWMQNWFCQKEQQQKQQQQQQQQLQQQQQQQVIE